MKKIFLVLIVLLSFMMSTQVFAISTQRDGQFIEITTLDDDWTATTNSEVGGYVLVTSIEFIPSAIGDRMIIHNGGINDAAMFDSAAVPVSQVYLIQYDPPAFANPVIDISDCTIGTAANAKVIIRVIKIGNTNIN